MKRATILIIEDERSLADVLTYNLDREGFNVVVARDGKDGLHQAAILVPDLIILEQELPIATGLQICRDLRANSETAGIPCLMLVDRQEPVDRKAGSDLGIVDRLPKPFSVKMLIQSVRMHLQAVPRPPEAASSAAKHVVLFLCTGNSARSQMAEALLRRYAASFFDIFSAGLQPRGIHPLTTEVMGEIGFDLTGHRSKGVGEFLGKLSVHRAVIVCQDVEPSCPSVWPYALSIDRWPFEDPSAYEGSKVQRLTKFRSIRDQIDERIRHWLIEVGIQPPGPTPRPSLS